MVEKIGCNKKGHSRTRVLANKNIITEKKNQEVEDKVEKIL